MSRSWFGFPRVASLGNDGRHLKDSEGGTLLIPSNPPAANDYNYEPSPPTGAKKQNRPPLELLLAAFSLIWNTARPPPTNLDTDIFTANGKAFPSGQPTWPHHFEPIPCGSSPQAALARDCHVDIIATARLPPKCIDSDLIAEFEAVHPWWYFRDRNSTGAYPVDHNALGSANATIYTTARWHVAHCLHMWKKLNRAFVHGWMTDGGAVTQWHTDHCSMDILQDRRDPDQIGAVVEVIYPPC